MPVTAITSTNVAQAIVKLVAADALPALVGNLVMGNLVNRNYEPVLAQAGDTVNVPIAPQLTANNIAEGNAVTPQIASLGNAQIVLNTHVEATFQVPDVTQCLSVPDLLRTYMQPAVVAIAEKSRAICSGCMPDSARTPRWVRRVRRPPRRSSTPRSPRCSRPRFRLRSRSISSSTRTPIRRYARFRASPSTKTRVRPAFDALISGSVGKIKDFAVFRSQYVPQTGSGPATTHNLAFTRDAIGLVIRRLPQPIPAPARSPSMPRWATLACA